MVNLQRFYPARFRAIRGASLERMLALAGAAAGLSAVFNAPLAGVVFAIEELTRSFEQRTSGVLITTIIFAGIVSLVSLALRGNYTYFGTIVLDRHFPDLLALAVLLLGIVTSIAGGVFCWLLLNTSRWMPSAVQHWRGSHPVAFGAACGLFIAVVGVLAGGQTFGSGYAEARAMLEGHSGLSASYPLLKMASMIGSYLPGALGGLFAPSLAIGVGIGNALHLVFGNMQLPMLIALGMVGYLAAVTQSPITSFVIVIEMIDGHALVISLMATALIASQVSKLFAPALYEALARNTRVADAARTVVHAVVTPTSGSIPSHALALIAPRCGAYTEAPITTKNEDHENEPFTDDPPCHAHGLRRLATALGRL